MPSSFLTVAAGAAPAFFTELVVLFVAGAAIAYLCFQLRLVPIVGFLLAGVLIGPGCLRLVDDPRLVDAAAEIGVILLLFTIGIELSLQKLVRLKWLIFGGGGLQVGLTTLATVGLLLPFGVGWRAALFTGFLVSLSSTAIVLKLLGDRSETTSEHGRIGLGLLIFQDLAIIVMVMLVPMLAGTGGNGGSGLDIAWALAKAGALIAAVLLVARKVMPRVLEKVALTCSPEIFLLTIVGICFGTAYLTSLAGVSLSLGAFLAGLVVSESRHSEHALGEILPLQVIFSALFFFSVGMLLDLRFLLESFPLVLAAIGVILVVKVLATGASALALRRPLPAVVASSLMLAQVGEFSFVLERAGREVGLAPAGLAEGGSQVFIAATVILMVLTPALTAFGVRLGRRLGRAPERGIPEPEALPAELPHLEDHVIIAGYGQASRRLVRLLEKTEIPFVIVTLSPTGAGEAEARGLAVLRGDNSRTFTLERVAADRARVMVIADDDPAGARRVASVARQLNPELRLLVRTRFVAEIEPLLEEGADRVVAEELESVVQLYSDVLCSYGLRPEEAVADEELLRGGGYSALRGEEVPPEARRAAPARLAIDREAAVALHVDPGTTSCHHLDQIREVLPSAAGCEECLETGNSWVHLRICMSCGHVGCCDSSPNRHATKHHASHGHAIIRSLEPGETWGWCYECRLFLEESEPSSDGHRAAPRLLG